MHVSFNPTYLCNMTCQFCYLTDNQKRDKACCSIEDYERQLSNIVEHYEIDQIDIYGGEVALLSEEVLNAFIDISLQYSNKPVNVITNFSKMHISFFRKDIELSISYDFDYRPNHEQVMNNILFFPHDVHILMLAGEYAVSSDPERFIQTFNAISNIKSVEIKPYSSNQSNQLDVKFSEFEDLIRRWIQYPVKNFNFINERNLDRCLNRSYSSWSDNHLYILPNGNLSVLEFDINNNEYFMETSSLTEYKEWSIAEQTRIKANKFCSHCDYIGHCLSEHLQDVKSLNNSCNGFKGLLDWYVNRS